MTRLLHASLALLAAGAALLAAAASVYALIPDDATEDATPNVWDL